MLSLSTSSFGCHVGDNFFRCIMYADDLILLSPSLSGLQHLVDICSVYAKDHNLVFNTKKTICTVVGNPKFTVSNICIDNQVIQWTNQFKYLGVNFSF